MAQWASVQMSDSAAKGGWALDQAVTYGGPAAFHTHWGIIVPPWTKLVSGAMERNIYRLPLHRGRSITI